MKAVAAVVVVAVLALQAASLDVQDSLSFDEEDAKNRPVSKVITLLKGMLKQLEKEGEDDQELYDKMACWCETNSKEKAKSIADAEAHIADLTAKIEELTASSGRLNTEISNLQEEVGKNQKALDEATALRQKQLAEFNGEEKDLLGSISALKAAVTVMSKHQSSLMQLPKSHVLGLAATLQHEMQQHASLLQGVITPSERKAVNSFIQAPEDYFDASPTFKQSYAPQGGEIYGVLKQMKETFENNLADAQKEESGNQQAYEDLKAAKMEEISAGQNQIEAKTEELADTDAKNAESKQDKEDTEDSLEADQQFLAMLKEKCAQTDKEWEERQKTRQLEMEACSKALSTLSSDDAHDLFTKTFNPSLLQTGSVDRRAKASQLLASVAQKVNNPRLATLATAVRLDAFTRVKKAIDDMVTQLVKEKADEIKHKDFCVDEFNKNSMATEKKQRDKSDATAKIEDLKMTKKTLSDEIAVTKGEIAEMQMQLKRAGEDREQENKEFQSQVADQRSTQKLLAAAMRILKAFYEKKSAALVQTAQEPAGPAPPPGFEAYKKSESANGVIGMLQQIINDAKAMEKDAIRAEEDAQKAYEAYVQDTNASVDAKSQEIVNKSEKKSQAEAKLVQANEEMETTMTELEQLSNYNAGLHSSCDFVMNNFEIRQTARDEEVEALKQAKAILSGSKFEDFLQDS